MIHVRLEAGSLAVDAVSALVGEDAGEQRARVEEPRRNILVIFIESSCMRFDQIELCPGSLETSIKSMRMLLMPDS